MCIRPLARNKILPVLNILKNLKRSMTSIIGPIGFLNGKPMLVDIITIIDPFGFCTDKPMQVEQMSNDIHYWLN